MWQQPITVLAPSAIAKRKRYLEQNGICASIKLVQIVSSTTREDIYNKLFCKQCAEVATMYQ